MRKRMFNKNIFILIFTFYIWISNNFVEAEIDDSNEFRACDYARFESHLQALTKAFELINSQLQVLEKKVDIIPERLYTEMKILMQDKEHDNQIISIKEILRGHDHLLGSLSEKLKNVENKIETTATESNQKELIDNGKELICTTSTYPYPTSCADHNPNYCANNKCRIFNQIYGPKPFYVSCDNQNYGGGWTVIQRRINGSVDFYRDWSEYKAGFGNIEGEFFIGLEKLYALTTALQPMELLIELKDFNDSLRYAKYDEFIVEDELENYKLLKVGKHSGNATDAFSKHQGYMFSTKDRDNDVDPGNCAVGFKAAWWFRKCFYSNLNGKYYEKEKAANADDGICWIIGNGCTHSLKFVQMMIRPRKI